jgi:bisphosphoglycerate-dependent phosphoglycerate mutase
MSAHSRLIGDRIDRRIPHRNTECSSRAGANMTEQASGRFENVGRKLDEHFGGCSERLEEDVKRVITYLNEKVVPEVRENSTKALRIAAEQLARLADHLERSRKAQP